MTGKEHLEIDAEYLRHLLREVNIGMGRGVAAQIDAMWNDAHGEPDE